MFTTAVLPDWVHWVAQDADGRVWGFEVEPQQYQYGWYENEVGRYLLLTIGAANPDWTSSLRRRQDYLQKPSLGEQP